MINGENNSSSSKLNLVCTSQSEICRSGDTISSTEVHKCENEDEEISTNVDDFETVSSPWDVNHSSIWTNVSAASGVIMDV